MITFLTKALSFLIKEFHDVRRQPRLMLSLVGGPLLVLAAFGATFRSSNPFIRVVLVWPENGVSGISQQQAVDLVGGNMHLVKVTSDEQEAMQMLEQGETDVVQIIPVIDMNAAEKGVRPEIRVISRTVDPTVEAWVRSLSYGEMNFINQRLLAQEADAAQVKAREVDQDLSNAQQELEQLRQNLNPQQIERAQKAIQELRPILTELEIFLPPLSMAQANLSPELSKLHQDIVILSDDLEELDQVLRQGDLETQVQKLESTNEEIATLRSTIDIFVAVSPDQLVSPIRETYTNQRGAAYGLVVFFAPAVLALLVQHLAITLASLGLVRERQMGAFEMFRVSPLQLSQIILGKSIAYILYVTIAGLILTGLLTVLQVPFPAYPGQYFVLLLMLSTASVGIGFLISAVSRTDSQAIQLTMLVLLLSIFFTGFFLPIRGFAWPAWIIALLLPMSHAIEGLQNLMLVRVSPGVGTWIFLGTIILLAFGSVFLIMRRQYRQVLD